MENLDNIPYAAPIHVDDANTLDHIHITEEQVLNCLDKLNVKKTPGTDTISPRMLKEAKDEFLKPLTSLFNKSLQTGTVPNEWKLANVTPIFKKGSKSLPK